MYNTKTFVMTDKKSANEQLDRTYIWKAFNMLPGFGFFALEIKDADDVVDSIRFSKNTDAESGKNKLYALLGKYPNAFSRMNAEFTYGFGFDLKITVWL